MSCGDVKRSCFESPTQFSIFHEKAGSGSGRPGCSGCFVSLLSCCYICNPTSGGECEILGQNIILPRLTGLINSPLSYCRHSRTKYKTIKYILNQYIVSLLSTFSVQSTGYWEWMYFYFNNQFPFNHLILPSMNNERAALRWHFLCSLLWLFFIHNECQYFLQ